MSVGEATCINKKKSSTSEPNHDQLEPPVIGSRACGRRQQEFSYITSLRIDEKCVFNGPAHGVLFLHGRKECSNGLFLAHGSLDFFYIFICLSGPS